MGLRWVRKVSQHRAHEAPSSELIGDQSMLRDAASREIDGKEVCVELVTDGGSRAGGGLMSLLAGGVTSDRV